LFRFYSIKKAFSFTAPFELLHILELPRTGLAVTQKVSRGLVLEIYLKIRFFFRIRNFYEETIQTQNEEK